MLPSESRGFSWIGWQLMRATRQAKTFNSPEYLVQGDGNRSQCVPGEPVGKTESRWDSGYALAINSKE